MIKFVLLRGIKLQKQTTE